MGGLGILQLPFSSAEHCHDDSGDSCMCKVPEAE